MSAIRGRCCRACGLPVKGHPGPYGMGKCTAGQVDLNDNSADERKESGYVQVIKSKDQQSQVVKDISIVSDGQEALNTTNKSDSPVKDTDGIDSTFYVGKYSLNNSTVDIRSPSLSDNEKNIDDSVFEECQEGSFVDGVFKECQEGSFVEPSIFVGPEDGVVFVRDLERMRLESRSDEDLDARHLLRGRTFVICLCDNIDCECDGEVVFEDSLAGIVTNIYFDPIDDDIDLTPRLSVNASSWSASRPNQVKLKMGGVKSPGILSSSGDFVVTASRVVELVKGRRELSTTIRGSLSFQIKVSSRYTKQGVRNPLKCKDVECNLYVMKDVESE